MNKFNFWRALNTVFYFSTLLVIVAYILHQPWGSMAWYYMAEKLGIIGGLYFFSDMFRKEMYDAKGRKEE